MGADGNVLEGTKYPNTRADARKFAESVAARYDCKAVCESTAWLWLKTYEVFEDLKISIVLANPLRLKLSQSGTKTDKIDARQLANRLRMDDIPTCHVHKRNNRRDLDLLRQRMILIKERTRALNRQHAICGKYDHPTSSGHGNTSGAKYQEYLNGLKLNPGDTRIMGQYVRHVRYLNGEIDMLEKLVAKAALNNEDARLIMTLSGFDAFSALLVAVSIDGIGRFAGPRQLVSFLGLCPRVYQSGDSTRHGRMKKSSDRALTWIMMHSALVAGHHNPVLSAYYEGVRKRHPPVVAQSHLAKKMAIYIWHMLNKRQPYRFHDQKAYQAKLVRLARLASRI